MKIEVTDAMKMEIVRLAAAAIASDLRRTINIEQVVADVRDKVSDCIAKQVAGEFHKRVNIEQTVSNAVAGFERRVNERIEKTLKAGVKVSIGA